MDTCISRKHRGHTILAASSAGCDPKLFHLLGWRISITGKRPEDLQFLSGEGLTEPEGGAQDDTPSIPTRSGKPLLERAIHHFDNGWSRRQIRCDCLRLARGLNRHRRPY